LTGDETKSEGKVVTEATKKFFCLMMLILFAYAIGAHENAYSITTQDSASQTTPADASGVMYFPADKVSLTFSKGATLYNGNPERNYRVQTFHRDKPGEVEVHTKDTDVFYMLEGSATFATGGAMVGGKDTAPNEIRGASMDGGVVRQVGKGDVIIIPANVTHWWKEVQQPITYFGVKVR
jgi:quercetin dioxygenase-like cupin family protein